MSDQPPVQESLFDDPAAAAAPVVRRRRSAEELAQLVGAPPPTRDQARVIDFPSDQPCLVVAGAGSGKTTTMANRVVALVANGVVAPEQVLGLTFTRKAAGELAAKIRAALGRLRRAGLVPDDSAEGEVAVSTYHSYAGRVVADHALRLGVEPSARLITPAVQWQLVTDLVSTYDGPMDGVPWAPSTVVDAVIALAGDLSEHLVTVEEVLAEGDRWRERLDAVTERVTKAIAEPVTTDECRRQLLPLVQRYAELKARRNLLDYGDQVALAARIARAHPAVGALERRRFPAVLLDEYQDTGHAQAVLLRALFGSGHPVVAVGDPCQSIYGWRGASAGNLTRFPFEFCQPEGEPAQTLELLASFRNGERVLTVANALSEELRADGLSVSELTPGAGRGGRGKVEVALLESAAAEAEWVAERVVALHGTRVAPDGQPWSDRELADRRHVYGDQAELVHWRDIAVLARKRSLFPALRSALEVRGVPAEVVGLGGLLTVPEVQDVVATLRVLDDPRANAALLRLLTGARWRIGPRDLMALRRRSVSLSSSPGRDLRSAERPVVSELADDPVIRAVAGLDDDEGGSLVDALDDLGPLDRYSPVGAQRFTQLRQELRHLRTRLSLSLPDLVAEVEQALRLDIEVASRAGSDPVAARADLDAFLDAAAAFAGDSEQPTLRAFLAYLEAAEEEEFGLEGGAVGASDSVKLMTVHAAKGLEWPVVFVPGLAAGQRSRVFPAKPRASTTWVSNARLLPFALRGDRASLPSLRELSGAALKAHHADNDRRDLIEERRLAYVAVTRAASLLCCSGHWWGSGKHPLGPSEFLTEIAGAAGVEGSPWEPAPLDDVDNPTLTAAAEMAWPSDHRHVTDPDLLARIVPVREAAELVRAATPEDGQAASDHPLVTAWDRDLELLLAERESAGRGGHRVELPGYVSVSTLVALRRDPGALARQLLRPLPRRPAPLARRGTAFHAWLEQVFQQQALVDLDELPGSADEGAAPDSELEVLKSAFQASEWWGRTPMPDGIEVPFETTVAGVVVRGRMDAVFQDDDGAFHVVDWKTGRPPTGEDAAAAAVQLAAYRVAWAELAGVPLEQVRAAFHYVRDNETVRPVDLLDRAGLEALISDLPAQG